MVTQFALMLIGLPPLLVWPLAKLRHRLDPDGRDFRIWGLALLFVSIPSVGPVVLALTMTPELAENLWPMRMWIISILALFISLRSWDVLRLPREKLGGWWRTTIFITMWPGMCYDGFLVSIGGGWRKRLRIVLIKSLSAAIRIPIGLGLFAFGAWMGCPDSSWMLDHLLKLFEIYFFMGGAHDVIVALLALAGWHLDDVFRWPMFSKSVLDFWQRYSRHINAWLRTNVFLAAGGRRHRSRAILLVFIFSSVIHEYVFIVALGWRGILGWQTSFFMLHGLVAIGGLGAGRHLIARGIHIPRSVKIALTFVFIYFSSLLFMHCMDALLIFHEGGVGTRLLNWGMGKWG